MICSCTFTHTLHLQHCHRRDRALRDTYTHMHRHLEGWNPLVLQRVQVARHDINLYCAYVILNARNYTRGCVGVSESIVDEQSRETMQAIDLSIRVCV